jgi:hypothetical protein
MFNRQKGLAWGATHFTSDTLEGFALGSTLTLALVLMWNLLLPTLAVENHVLEVARQALYGNPLPP